MSTTREGRINEFRPGTLRQPLYGRSSQAIRGRDNETEQRSVDALSPRTRCAITRRICTHLFGGVRNARHRFSILRNRRQVTDHEYRIRVGQLQRRRDEHAPRFVTWPRQALNKRGGLHAGRPQHRAALMRSLCCPLASTDTPASSTSLHARRRDLDAEPLQLSHRLRRQRLRIRVQDARRLQATAPAWAGSITRNSSVSVCRAISASVPASSTPVGPPPMTTNVNHAARFAASGSRSARSNAIKMRRRISSASSSVFSPGVLRPGAMPKYECVKPAATIR